MSDTLDLRGMDQRHKTDPQFRAALHRRVEVIVEGGERADTDEPADVTTIELEPANRHAGPLQRRRWAARVTIALAGAAAVVTLVAIVSTRDGTIVSTPIYDGWVTFAASDGTSDEDEDVYVARRGSPPRRLAGSDTDDIVHVCPAFSPDASRLAFGQAEGSEGTAYRNAAVVISDVSADGEVVEAARIPLPGATPPPCAIWSADGRWVAFGVDAPLVQGPDDADGKNPRKPTVHSVDEVWVVDTRSDDIRRLTGLLVTDLEWAPDAVELAFIGDGISIYSVASNEIRPLGGRSGIHPDQVEELTERAYLNWSPDGRTIAFTGPRPGASVGQGAIWLMDADGTNERILVPEVRGIYGIGPLWSPDGTRIAYQRNCGVDVLGVGCREAHEVVLITLDDEHRPSGTEQVLAAPQTEGPNGPIWWYPYRVTWSSYGRALLYFAGPAAETDSSSLHNGVVEVPLDGTTPPIVLSGDLDA